MGVLDWADQISKDAYEQEWQRMKILIQRADYMIRWLTLFVAIFNIAVPLIAKETNLDYSDCIFVSLYIFIMVFLVGSILPVIIINFPQKTKMFPTGETVLKEMQSTNKLNQSEEELKYNSILYRDVTTEVISKQNNRRAKCVTISGVALIVSLVLMVVFFIYITKREQVEPSKNSSKQSELLAQKNILGDFEKKKAQMPNNYMSS